MRIDIIGGGAIGLLYGSRLAAAGADVVLWTRTERQSKRLALLGVRLLSSDGAAERTVKLRSEWAGSAGLIVADEASADAQDVRWIIVAVKQTDIGAGFMEQLRGMIAAYPGESAILCLQNGLGHLERLISELEDTPVYAAVTTEGARRLDERTVQHTGEGELWISELAENGHEAGGCLEKSQKMLLNLLQTAGIDVFLSNDMKNRIYYKLLINAVINPLTAIYDVLNGELPKQPNRFTLMKELYKETEAVLLQDGMRWSEDGWERLLEVCDRTGGNVSSMLSDVRAGRETEISAINGAIIRLAARYGMEAPLNAAVTAIIYAYRPKLKGKE